MALTANFFITNKRRNSTLIPDPSGAVPAQIELKAPTSFTTPEISIAGIPNPYLFNYCQITEFSRYYWVTDWRWEEGRWIASLRVDVLASFKTAIGNTHQYVLRAASRMNPFITDNMYPVTAEFTSYSKQVTATRSMTFKYQDGVFIVGIIAKSATNLGSITYYAFTYTQFAVFRNAMFNDINWAGSITDVSSDLLKTLVNPFDYIVSCKWCPCTDYLLYFDTAVSSIPLGYWSFSCSAYLLSTVRIPLVQHQFSIDVTDFSAHPQAQYGSYLNWEPYTQYKLLIAPYGVIELPSEAARSGITCIENIDLISGEGVLNIYAGAGGLNLWINPLKVVTTDMFVNIQIAQVRSGAGIEGAGLNAGFNMAEQLLSLAPDGPVKSAASGIVSSAHTSTNIVRVSGDNGGFARFAQYGGFNPVVSQQFNYIASPDPAHLGYALCEDTNISDLSGYIQCAHPEVGTVGTEPEQQEINSYLTAGFFYE